MSAAAWFVWTVIPCITLWYGWELGQHSDRSKQQSWCDGYAAGLAKSDDMWPTVVRRWEMDV
jgi:uncharacterized protein YecA (UPF0149 family)